ncbi:MAG: hypothetical protein ABR532_04970 [Candidatus Dormibacteria bacterium]
MSTQRWSMLDPSRSYPATPVVDDESAVVVDEAVHCLSMLRSPMWEGDALARLHALASLAAQINVLLPETIRDALDQDHSWADIATQLGTSSSTARRLCRTAPPRSLPLD